MVDKYGLPLTDSDWAGLPLRVGQFGEAGRVEDLQGHADGILLWSGGVSEVTIDSSCASDRITRNTFTRRAGMIDFLPLGTTLYQVRWKGDPSTCVSVNIPPGAREQLLGPDAPGLNPEAGPLLGVLDGHASDLVRRLHDQVSSRMPFGSAYVQGISLALAAYVSTRYGGNRETAIAKPRTLPPPQRQAVAEFVEEHLASNLSLVDMALVAGYSADHFARLFKGSFGLTPHQYLVARRVERAKALLRQPELSIAQIASHCGFASQPHLNEVFKRATGSTPAGYRRSWPA